jgi:mycothiol system anti-sigma-R factor
VSFLESLKRLFGGAGQNGPSRGTHGSEGSGPTSETAVAMIPCEEASARLFEYLDGELEDVSEEEVRLHLEVCEACYPRAQFEKHFLETLRRSRNGGQASESLRERVLQSLAEDEHQD